MKISALLPSVLLLVAAGAEAARSSPPSTHPKLSKTTAADENPRNEARKAALEQRVRGNQASKRRSKTQHEKKDASPNAVEVDYNWAGAVIEAPPSGETWKTVTGTMTLPELIAPSQSYGVLGEYFF